MGTLYQLHKLIIVSAVSTNPLIQLLKVAEGSLSAWLNTCPGAVQCGVDSIRENNLGKLFCCSTALIGPGRIRYRINYTESGNIIVEHVHVHVSILYICFLHNTSGPGHSICQYFSPEVYKYTWNFWDIMVKLSDISASLNAHIKIKYSCVFMGMTKESWAVQSHPLLSRQVSSEG